MTRGHKNHASSAAKNWTRIIPTSVITKGGWTVDLQPEVWVLPLTHHKLDWGKIKIHNPDVLTASQAYVVHQLKTHSIGYAEEAFRILGWISKSAAFISANESESTIPMEAVLEARDIIQRTNLHWRSQFNLMRRWYSWCAEMGFSPFSEDVARNLRRIRSGPDPNYGRAILSGDGPFTREECRHIVHAMKGAQRNDTGSQKEFALVWLLLCLGANIGPISQLRESDLQKEGPYWFLRVPRHKKRDSRPRTQFKFRRIPAYLAELLQAHIRTNQEDRKALKLDNSFDWPLFYRVQPWSVESMTLPDPMAVHEVGSTALNGYLGFISKKFNLKDRSGKFLRLNARRFRYTLATELIKDGAPPIAVAEALDHTSLRHIMVYYNAQSDIIPRLDKALTAQLAPISDAFQGKVVPKEADSPRGHDPGSRIFFGDPGNFLFVGVGSCGCFGKCRLASPIACYTCKLFNPWADAPHALLLDQLLRRRDYAESEGQEPSVVQLYDHTIIAIQQVVDLCANFHLRGGTDGIPIT